MTELLDIEIETIDGDKTTLRQLGGTTYLIVNVASACGFTRQYEGMQALYEAKQSEGLVVVGFPCNQFGAQEPGAKAEIKEFCAVNFAIDFPMSDKILVKGQNAHPLYKWLKAETGKAPKWNFHKFLIGSDGQAVRDFSSLTKPQSKRLIRAVEAALPKN